MISKLMHVTILLDSLFLFFCCRIFFLYDLYLYLHLYLICQSLKHCQCEAGAVGLGKIMRYSQKEKLYQPL